VPRLENNAQPDSHQDAKFESSHVHSAYGTVLEETTSIADKMQASWKNDGIRDKTDLLKDKMDLLNMDEMNILLYSSRDSHFDGTALS
jgi:hypothetical protein